MAEKNFLKNLCVGLLNDEGPEINDWAKDRTNEGIVCYLRRGRMRSDELNDSIQSLCASTRSQMYVF
jgi:hypothetical protein